MNLVILKSLIQDKLDLTDKEIATWCNTPSISVAKERFITKRSLFAVLGVEAGTTIVETMRAMANNTNDPAHFVYQQIFELLDEVAAGGLDISLVESQGFVDSLVAGNVLTAEQGNTIKALGKQLISPAEGAGIGYVNYWHVARARGV